MSDIFLTYEWLLPSIPFVVAFLSVCWIHPRLVRLAYLKGIVDNPDHRKLQRSPVPVLGGCAVFFGISLGMGIVSPFFDSSQLTMIIAAMTLMLYIGTMDDILSLSPAFRFVVEILCVVLLVVVGGYTIDDFHGLWGIGSISCWWGSLLLTVFAAVGIINAINLIDGVNGLSSGYCVMACLIFGSLFFIAGDLVMVLLAAVCVGALIPFFLHNVFGKSSRMFIGDGGTLVMGLVMSVFVIHTLDSKSLCGVFADRGFGLIPFTLAVLAVPVFDTLRVMSARVRRHVSPFHPDKTHLHHLFIDLGFSHIGTTSCILSLNVSVVLCLWALYAAGVSVAGQLYAVVALGALVTFGLYYLVRWSERRNSRFYRLLLRFGRATQFERRGFFLWLQHTLDRI
ncbi:MAG: undecaprenyl/decaprenyl-phosphate alpha-N-acetylglucosaminyl 1-phosphate transferase [Alistipes sp.]|nr:undecaprenyl/decaprenyl-phosphate alpha-N-acetylglucosaminyl 1-phosphate transferase [Alistipes sp.]